MWNRLPEKVKSVTSVGIKSLLKPSLCKTAFHDSVICTASLNGFPLKDAVVNMHYYWYVHALRVCVCACVCRMYAGIRTNMPIRTRTHTYVHGYHTHTHTHTDCSVNILT